MAMQDVRLYALDKTSQTCPRHSIGRVRITMDGQAINTKLHARRNLGQRSAGSFTAGEAVGDQADMMAALGLTVGEIKNMSDDSTNRSAYGVKDTERLIGSLRHSQDWHSSRQARSQGPRIADPTDEDRGRRTLHWKDLTKSFDSDEAGFQS